MNKLSYYIKKYWYAYAFTVCTVISVIMDMVSPQVTSAL